MKFHLRNTVFFIFSMVYTLSCAYAQTKTPKVTLNEKVILQNTQHYEILLEEKFSQLRHPWGIAWYMDAEDADKERVLVSERNGDVWIFVNGKAKRIVGLPQDVYKSGQGGWFDIVVGSDQRIYLSYAKGDSKSNRTAVVSFTLDRNMLEIESDSVQARELSLLYQMNMAVASTIHFGGAMSLGRNAQGKELLFLALGERGQRYEAQNLNTDHGTVVQIPLNSSKYSIVSFGHRNAQGLHYDSQRNILYETEHGPMGGDEFNLIKMSDPIANYGWPIVSYGKEYGSGAQVGEGVRKEGIEEPLYYWPISPALSGLSSYYGEMFPQWNGNLFASALKLQQLYRIVLDEAGTRVLEVEPLLLKKVGRIRSVKLGPDGSLYIVTDQAQGKVFKITRLSN